MTMVKYLISKENKLVIEKFEDEVTFDLIQSASLAIWANSNYDTKHKVLIDIRNCEVKIGFKDIPRMASFFLKNSKSSVGFAIILANNNQSIAKSFLFKSNVSKLMHLHVMSDFNEALEVLEIDESFYNLINSDKAESITIEAIADIEV